MAEEAATELNVTNANAEDMDLEVGGNDNGESKAKRAREEEEKEEGEGNGDVSKKQKVDEGEKSVEEERWEKKVDGQVETGRVRLGPKEFGSSVEMFDYFYKFLHFWPPNVNVNKYEYKTLLDLLRKGHAEAEKKIGVGIHAFQVRYHPMFKSRCFFLIRDDVSVDDFSFRKCVDHILPLPEDMKTKPDANRALGGSGGKGRGGKSGGHGHGKGGGHGHGKGGGHGHGKGGHGRGRGGKWKN